MGVRTCDISGVPPTPPTVFSALRATATLIWSESDAYARRKLTFSFGLLFMSSVLEGLIPVTYKLLIDAFSTGSPAIPLLVPAALLGAYVIGIFISNAASTLRQLVHGLGLQRLNSRIAERVFTHVLRLPLSFHLNRKTGAIGETLGQGLGGCQLVLEHAVFTLLPVIIQFLAIIVVLAHLEHTQYLVIILCSALLYGYTFWRVTQRIAEPARNVSASHINSHATLTDSLLNYETIKCFSGEGTAVERYVGTLRTRESALSGLLRVKTRNGMLLETIYAVSIVAALGLAGYQVFQRQMSIGDFVLINTYITGIYRPLETLSAALRDITQGLAFMQKMLDIFRVETERDTVREHRPPPARGELAFERVTFRYQSDRTILEDVSFRVPAGRTLAIVGASGSGKSSLIRLLLRMYEPGQGRILLDGTDIRDLPLAVLRGSIAVVPQDTVLFNGSIAQNIGFGRCNATRQEIENAARLAHLHDFITSLPQGYDTPVGERGLKLSGGEKQRIAIARAVLKNPLIFVFDEATSSLDSRTEREILRNLIEISQHRTTLIIAHRLSTVVHADEIVVLDRGRAVERGSHASLLAREGHFAALWRAQHTAVSA